MYRLQHLCVGRHDPWHQPLHPEHRLHGRVAQGLAPRTRPPQGASDSVLVVGGGPTGLEAAHALGKRGYQVTLAEVAKTLGGRISAERRLPGLSAWGRVADYRTGQLAPMAMCTAISTAR